MSRTGFHLTLDDDLKKRCSDYCDRQQPPLSLARFIHVALYDYLAKNDNQLEEVEK